MLPDVDTKATTRSGRRDGRFAGRRLGVCALLMAPVTAFPGGDHHMHIYSEDGAGAWAAICAATPEDCEGELPIPTTALTAGAAIEALDAAGLDKGAILSLAYFYGAPELEGSEWADHRRVRAENAFTANQVGLHPDRLAGFFSLNPLADYAVEEARFWAEQGGFAGLKLHLANSALEFDNPAHLERLRDITDVMNDHGMAVLIHLRNLDPDYGYEHAAAWIEQVAQHAKDVTWQLAHMGGWGGYDEGTDAAVRAILDAIAAGTLDRDRVWFDLAAVVDEGMPAETYALISRRLREIGLDRVLFASDWDEADPEAYFERVRTLLPLTDAEAEILKANEAPYFVSD